MDTHVCIITVSLWLGHCICLPSGSVTLYILSFGSIVPETTSRATNKGC